MITVTRQSQKAVIDAFRARWNTLKSRALKGKTIQQAVHFEAATIKERASLAKDYYGIAHIKAMCALSDAQIVTNLKPVCLYLDLKSQDDPPTAEELLSREYVLFTSPHEDFSPQFKASKCSLDDELLETWDACPYPSMDWYERVGGFYTFLYGFLMKSTGEVFTAREKQNLTESVVYNVTGNDSGELWTFEVEPARLKNQMVIYIGTDSAKWYVASIQDAIVKMSAARVAAMVRGILNMEQTEKKYLPAGMLKLAEDHAKQRRPDTEVFKIKLAVLLARQKDAFKIRCGEEPIGVHFFNERPYYHHRLGKLCPLRAE